MANVKLDLSGAKKFLDMLKDCPNVKVGIIGDKATQEHQGNDSKLTNAQIGFIQEFGKKTAPKIPARSFIRMPLELHLGDYLKKKKTFAKANVERALKEGKKHWLSQQLGAVALEVILDAFATSGWGKWAPNSPQTIAKKGSNKPLIDTGELRRSIDFEVME